MKGPYRGRRRIVLCLMPILPCLVVWCCRCKPVHHGRAATVLVAIETQDLTARLVSVTDLPTHDQYRVGCFEGGEGYEPIEHPIVHKKRLIYGTHQFGPLEEIPVFSGGLCPPSMPPDSIVQFSRPALTPGLRRRLLARQFSLQRVTGNAQFLFPTDRLVDLAHLVSPGDVEWVVPLQPGLKLDSVAPVPNTRSVQTKADDASVNSLESWFHTRGVAFEPASRSSFEPEDLRFYSVTLRTDTPNVALAERPEVTRVAADPQVQLRAAETLAKLLQANRDRGRPRGPRPRTQLRSPEDRLRGERQQIGIIDDSLDVRHCFFRGFRDTVRGGRKVIYLESAIPPSPEAGPHGTAVSGIAAGEDFDDPDGHNRGEASRAGIVFMPLGGLRKKGHLELEEGLQAIEEKDAHVISASWGDDTCRGSVSIEPRRIVCPYNTMEKQTDDFLRSHDEDLVTFAVRNATKPEVKVAEPENAKNAIAVAASVSGEATPGHEIGSGASGPTDDGRRKPEIVAPGCRITAPVADTSCDLDLAVAEQDDSECATSWAAPEVAGAAVLVREFFGRGFFPSGEEHVGRGCRPTGALLKAMLLSAAVNVSEAAKDLYPSDREGWGRLDLGRVIRFSGPHRRVPRLVVLERRDAQGLRQGEVLSFQVKARSLRATLVWMDPAPDVLSSGELVNDLDLIVRDDLGGRYCGNHFNDVEGTSVRETRCATHLDHTNNVEQVIVGQPKNRIEDSTASPGPLRTFTVIVQAQSVTTGVDPLAPRQGFALVVRGEGLEGGLRSVVGGTCSNVWP